MDPYSRTVAFLKVLLPLVALGILSTLFLLSRSIDPTATIPFSEQDVADRVRSQQVTEPYFSGTTAQGDDIVVHASVARPGGPGTPASAEDVDARITMADGVKVALRSDTVSYEAGREFATFSGNVRITSSTGFVVTTEQLDTSLEDMSGSTPGEVRATGPLGDLTAGRMEFATKNKGGPLHMVFKNRVKLVYDPAKTKD